MPSGLSESPNTGGFNSDGGYDSGPSYDANNPNFGSDPTDSNFFNLPPVRTGTDGSPDFASIYTDLSNLGDNGGTYDTSYPTYDAMSPLAFDNMADWANLPPAYDGNNGSLDFQAAALDALDAGDRSGSGEEGFWGTDFGKALKKFGMTAMSLHPVTRTPMAIYNAISALQSGEMGQGLGNLFGLATKNNLAGAMVGLGIDAATGKPVGQRALSQGMSVGGGMAGGPVGATLGGMVGSKIGAGIDQGKATPNQTQQGNSRNSGDNYGNMLADLANLYAAQRAQKTADRYAQAQQQQIASLQGMFQQQQGQMPQAPEMAAPDMAGVASRLDAMFGPGSESAKTLRTQLERKDAAAGRRSQYGPREVELLARLMQMRAQAEPSYMNAEVAAANAANQSAYSVYQTQMAARNNDIQNWLRGQQLSGVGSQASYNAQQQADLMRQQQLAALITLGRDSGAYDYLANMWGN